MYLTNIEIANNGRVERLVAQSQFDPNGLPLPFVIIGENGSGKTNLLSIIADAIFEASTEAFQDALPQQGLSGRSFFRVSGGKIITYGKDGYAVFLKFDDRGTPRLFIEKSGTLSDDDRIFLRPTR